MKKNLVLAIALGLAISVVGCTSEPTTEVVSDNAAVETEAETETDAETDADVEVEADADVETEVETDADAEVATVMSYADYVAADIDTEVVVETYVQAKQSWWEDKATVYTQDEDGAYFLYEMACTEEEYETLTEGTKIKVTGYKSEWSGEVEIIDATFEVVDGNFVAEPVDVTDKLGTDELIDFQNQKVLFTDMTVVSVEYKNEQPGDDIYVTFSKDDAEYSFCLEYYLNGSDEEFYNLVGGLEEGQVVDVEGFLYWYEGVNTHITAVTVK